MEEMKDQPPEIWEEGHKKVGLQGILKKSGLHV
jgi:hypothetical protein